MNHLWTPCIINQKCKVIVGKTNLQHTGGDMNLPDLC